MYRVFGAALAIVGLTVRMGLGLESFSPCGNPPPCGCAPTPVEACCAPASAPAEQRAAAPAQPPATPAEQPPAIPEPLSPPPFDTPEPAVTPPVEQPPRDAEAPATEPAPRDSAPEDQAPEPTAPPEPADYEDLFSGESAEEPGATDGPPGVESAPAESEPAPGADPADDPAGGEEEPAATPAAEDLFTPTGAHSEPGGWGSDATRAWTDARGRALVSARVAGANADHATLIDNAGAATAVRYAELSDGDLRFLWRQIEARRAQLAAPAKELLAKKAR